MEKIALTKLLGTTDETSIDQSECWHINPGGIVDFQRKFIPLKLQTLPMHQTALQAFETL